ncbi:hypothetical protein FA95DRAFT_1613689 [Auriscalpium vulgare]|uniref:Uncharacterized protein n=1 Tax=Auriscalpium vulgare TaxID=40419 RepID=A0ACB8R1M2_9AGAM|nr:hypothetical protein FA95DRAFT_1613689 [Auriscalpium vulgare]
MSHNCTADAYLCVIQAPATPTATPGHKRATESEAPRSARRLKKSRSSRGEAVEALVDLTGAIKGLIGESAQASTSAVASGSGPVNLDLLSTPARRRYAIQALERNAQLSPTSFVKMVGHIQENSGWADAYLAVTKKEYQDKMVEDKLDELF